MDTSGASWSPALVPRLSMLRADGRVHVELLVPDDLVEPLHAAFDQPVDDKALELAITTSARLLRRPAPDGFWEEARTAGGLLFRMLVPEALRESLGRLADGPLLVRTNLRGIPWELLHDGREFWGFSFALGKQTLSASARATDATLPAIRAGGVPRVLLVGSDPANDLRFVAAEIDQLYGALETIADVRCLNGPLATFTSVTAALAEGFDIVHYCGHISTAGDAGPTLVLADGHTLSPSTFTQNLAGRPIVFLNGCSSGFATEPSADGDAATPLASFADHVLHARATAVVATLHDVRDAHAGGVARVFYERLFAHEPIGLALRDARRTSDEAATGAPWPGGLAYALFGNPAHVPVPSVPVATTRSDFAPPAPRAAHISRRALIAAGGVAAACGVAWIASRRDAPRRTTVPPAQAEDVVLWVKAFVNATEGNRVDTLGSTLSDRVAERLRRLRSMTVYSASDTATSEHEGAGELEIVRQLDANKMVVGSYRVDGTSLHATVRIVDVGTGLAELTSSVDGTTARLDDVALDLAEVVAQTLRILRFMLDGEGAPDADDEPRRPRSSLFRRLAAIGPARAEAADDEPRIRAFLEQYRVATERRDLDAIAALYEDFPAPRRAAQMRYFDTVGDLRVQLDVHRIQVSGDDAVVAYKRTDDFIEKRTGRPMHLEVELEKTLRRSGETWKLVAPSSQPD